MSNTIESILSKPNPAQQQKYNLIIAMSKDVSRGYGDLKNAIGGGGSQKLTKQQQKNAFIVNGQITTLASKREDIQNNKRKI